MAAILQTKGPVITPAIVKHTWKFLYMMTTKMYVKAAEELQALNLGTLIPVRGTTVGHPSQVFIKKKPEEVMDVLQMNPDLCEVEYYARRYNQPISKSTQGISLAVRHKLASMGVVPQKLLV